MPNKRYERGRRFEYRVKRFLEGEGWVVIRAAGSKPIDLIAFKDGTILFIECKKRGYIPRDQRDFQEGLARRAGATYVVVTPKNFREFKENVRKGAIG
ncbi:MAG: restriction endonuclease [Deltaproteobacteria bacterium]|nr:restriction endonuclease [Deltaproteobacteria bacterium]